MKRLLLFTFIFLLNLNLGFTQSTILNNSPEALSERISDTWVNPTNAVFTGSLTEVLDAAFDSITNMSTLTGFNAAMILEDGTVWKRAEGMAAEEPLVVSLSTDHLMGMGSISKTFVSATILLLMEDGLLTLDDTIGQYITGYENVPNNVTIRQLLSHRSGINDYLNENPATVLEWVNNPDSIWVEDSLLNNYVLETNFPPGQNWSYSNTNYLLAGKIIENITGQVWYDVVRDRIINPLNLTSTFTYPWESPEPQPFSHAWLEWDALPGVDDLQGTGISMDGFFSMASSAGCLISTPEDLVLFSNALYGGDLLQPASLEELQTDYSQNPLFGIEYGLGALSFINLPGNPENWGHTGNLIYKSVALYFPEKGVSIAVQQNDNRINSPGLPAVVDFFDVFLVLLDACESYVPTTSTSDLIAEHQVNLFPNPVDDMLTIKYTANASQHFPLIAKLTDINGRSIRTFSLAQKTTSLNLKELGTGVYFLHLGDEVKRVMVR